jgi:hypothetical protein
MLAEYLVQLSRRRVIVGNSLQPELVLGLVNHC